MKKMKVAIVGVGNISAIYLENLTGPFADRITVLGCTDLVPGRADGAATQFKLPRRYASLRDVLADSDVELVLNISAPPGHFPISMAAVEAGKHVYVEKPLCMEAKEAAKLLARAEAKGVRVGCAPDTFLGGGLQTCRKLIDDGVIGEVVGATAFMMSHGPEGWHPNPEFFYKKGGGPMFDMGPYYLTALVHLIGPIARVSGATRVSFPQRKILSKPLEGTMIDVEVPTHVAGHLEFESGPIGTIITSFDVFGSDLPRIEIYGSKGTLSVPDPNTFGGPVRYRLYDAKTWIEAPFTHGYQENSRGIGVVDMATAIRKKKPHRASGTLAAHVLETMHGIHIAAKTGRRYTLKQATVRPQAMPMADC